MPRIISLLLIILFFQNINFASVKSRSDLLKDIRKAYDLNSQGNFNNAKQLLKSGLESDISSMDDSLKFAYYNLFAHTFENSCSYDSAKLIYTKGIEVLKNEYFKTVLYLNRGSYYLSRADYVASIEDYYKVLKYSSDNKNLTLQTMVYKNIGLVYKKTKEYNRALENFHLAIASAKTEKNKPALLQAIMDCATVYRNIDSVKAAESYFVEALQLAKEINDKERLAQIYLNRGNLYLQMKDYYGALKLYNSALDILKQKNIPVGYLMVYLNLGRVYAELNQYNKAMALYDSAAVYASMLKMKSEESDVYNFKSLLYEKMGNYKKALEYEHLFNNLNDSLSGRAKQLEIEKLSYNYKNARKDAEIAKQKLIISERTEIIYLFASVMLVIIVFLVLRIRSIKKIKEKNAQLQEMIASREKFFSIIAHDLRSPFTGLFGFSEFLIDSLKNNDVLSSLELAENLKEIINEMYELLETLLEWAEIQRNGVKAYPKILLLNKSVEAVASVYKGKTEHKQLVFENYIPEEMEVFADEHMLETVLRNLVSNAIKFTHKNGKVSVSVVPNGRFVEVSVTDTGIGIPAEIASKLFTSDQSIKRKGTEKEASSGLGMSICKEYVERNGGKIRFETTPGQGTTFHFTVPKAV